MVTGVSLKGADAALVLLEPTETGYAPLALALKGAYNRLGAIDGIEQDAHARLLLRYLRAQYQSGALALDADYLNTLHGEPLKTLEQFLAAFERNVNDYDQTALLDGQSVVFALIARAVWEALARALPPAEDSPAAEFYALFGAASIASAIYPKNLTQIEPNLHELAAVNGYLTQRGLVWKPADEPGQDYPAEMRQYLAEARAAFSGDSIVFAALQEYEREVGDLLNDD
jgi:hypothetical protein